MIQNQIGKIFFFQNYFRVRNFFSNFFFQIRILRQNIFEFQITSYTQATTNSKFFQFNFFEFLNFFVLRNTNVRKSNSENEMEFLRNQNVCKAQLAKRAFLAAVIKSLLEATNSWPQLQILLCPD